MRRQPLENLYGHLTVLAGLLAVGAAAAQEPAEAEADARRYTVEFVVFRYAEDVAVGTEVFPPEEPPAFDRLLAPDAGDDVPVFSDVAVDPDAPAGLPSTPDENTDAGDELQRSRLGLVLSIPDALTIQDVLEKLERLDVYEIVLHGGWTQNALAPEDARPIELTTFGDIPAGLEGSFTLYLGRFLHLVVDLTLAADDPEAMPSAYADPEFTFGDSRVGYGDDPFRSRGRVLYRIEEDRILKNDDIRYYDHPKFGVLTKVMRVEEPDDAASADLEPTPLIGRSGQ